MNFGNIILNSFKFPFKDLKHLGFVYILFLILLILPAGVYIGNSIAMLIGVVGSLIFILIAPGYGILVIKSGINQSSEVPSIKIGRSIINTLKLLILHICYIAIPSTIAFLLVLFATNLLNYPFAIFESTLNLNLNFTLDLVSGFFNAIGIIIIVTLIVRLIFSLLSYIAKARLSKTNSLIEALKIHRVVLDIKKIGLLKFIGWCIIMAILLVIFGIIAFFILFIHYIGLIVYLCVMLPIIYVIYNHSLGLLYSDLSDDENSEDMDLDNFEREIEYLKYGLPYREN